MKQFQMASGSITGRDHLKPLGWKNGQDAVCTLDLLEQNGIAIAVVSDGCGSGDHSEVGAKLAAPYVARRILYYLPRYLAGVREGKDPAQFRYFEDIRQDLLAWMRAIAYGIDPNLIEGVRSYCLYTLIGFIVTPHHSFVFSVGDGIYFVNGEMTRLGPFNSGSTENAPPYVAYGMFREGSHDADPELCKFQVNAALPTASVQSILVGTDGVVDLVNAAKKPLPSLHGPKGEPIPLGPISQFWEDPTYFESKDGANPIRRKLALANNAREEPDWANWRDERIMRRHGLLPDDTTLAVIRRAEPPKISEVKK